MTKLDPSFGHLKNLTDLILRNCKSVKELPQEVSQLTSLIRLDLTGCYQISALPEPVRHLKQLNWLSLQRCSSLTEIPECICYFLNLGKLDASHCQCIAFLPNWIEKLESLFELDLSWTAIEELPHSIVSLENLKFLSVSHCYRLKFLPWFPLSLTTPEARGCGKLGDVPGIMQMKLSRRLQLRGCRSLEDSFLERLQVNILENLCYVFRPLIGVTLKVTKLVGGHKLKTRTLQQTRSKLQDILFQLSRPFSHAGMQRVFLRIPIVLTGIVKLSLDSNMFVKVSGCLWC
uniref:Uncharacterized protein n=1 Tax=Nymphaea colorata TaxID=210225 RepID=A0A5K0ZUZ3_9MAGN